MTDEDQWCGEWSAAANLKNEGGATTENAVDWCFDDVVAAISDMNDAPPPGMPYRARKAIQSAIRRGATPEELASWNIERWCEEKFVQTVTAANIIGWIRIVAYNKAHPVTPKRRYRQRWDERIHHSPTSP